MKSMGGRVACTSSSSIGQEQQAPWASTWSADRLRFRPREAAAAAHSIFAQSARREGTLQLYSRGVCNAHYVDPLCVF